MKSQDGNGDLFAADGNGSNAQEVQAMDERAIPLAEDAGDKWEMDWVEGKEIVVQQQQAIAVYTNPAGGIVIREERTWNDEEDAFIVLASPDAAYRLLGAIQRELDKNGARAK